MKHQFYPNNPEPETPAHLIVKSEAFENRGKIPLKYSDEGTNVNPPLTISNIPKNTKSVAVIMEDADARDKERNHWVMWNLPPCAQIPEGHVQGIAGINDFNHRSYCGPDSSSQGHRYVFKVYALDVLLHMQRISGRTHVENAMKNHVIGFGKLTGVYEVPDLVCMEE